MNKIWQLSSPPDENIVNSLSRAINVNSTISAILVQRGVQTFANAKTFFRPDLNELHDPFLMKDMDKAVNRLSEAVFSHEKILIYGDYDVDGTTAVSMVYSFLKKFSKNIDFYIPDRHNEGYGISEEGVRYAVDHDIKLMICLDCGIKAVKKIALANEYGLDVIICDHHLAGSEIPKALAVLNPKQQACNYPFDELSGCGVGFKLLQGFCLQNTIDQSELCQFLDFVAVSICSDIVPMIGENRVLVHFGLKKLNENPSLGLRELKEVSSVKKNITTSEVVFYIGPRINAAGRLTHARESVNLLINENQEELKDLARNLNDRNTDRKEYDRSITQDALEMIERDFPQAKSSVLFNKHWHKGVVGIVASRCVEHFYRPTIILTESEGIATGSARSVEGFDIHSAIDRCGDLLSHYGGHRHAAGVSLKLENVDAFREKFEQVVSSTILPEQLQPKIIADQKVNFDFVSFKGLEIINQMAPFGPFNLQPIFWTENVFVKNPPRTIKESHIKMMIYQNGFKQGFEAIGFGLGNWVEKITPNKPFQILYHLEINRYNGNESIQINLKDIKLKNTNVVFNNNF